MLVGSIVAQVRATAASTSALSAGTRPVSRLREVSMLLGVLSPVTMSGLVG